MSRLIKGSCLTKYHWFKGDSCASLISAIKEFEEKSELYKPLEEGEKQCYSIESALALADQMLEYIDYSLAANTYHNSRLNMIFHIELHGDYYMPLNRDYAPIGTINRGFRQELDRYSFLRIHRDKVNLGYLQECITGGRGDEHAVYLWNEEYAPRTRSLLLRHIMIVKGMFRQLIRY